MSVRPMGLLVCFISAMPFLTSKTRLKPSDVCPDRPGPPVWR